MPVRPGRMSLYLKRSLSMVLATALATTGVPVLVLQAQAPAVPLMVSGTSCAAVVPTPSSTSEVAPVSTALHLLPPAGKDGPQSPNLDRSLLEYLEIRPCDRATSGCQALASLTSQGTKRGGMDFIHLLNNRYQVNWKPEKDDVGKAAEIRVLVVGLLVASTPHVVKNPANVPLHFQVDNHPRVRARVLHYLGKDAIAVTTALIDEFHLRGFDITLMLHAEEFSSSQIAEALRLAFNATPAEATGWMRDAGVRVVEIARALFGVYQLTADGVAATLREAGYSAADVFSAIKATAPGWTIEVGERALQTAGFCANHVFAAVQPDLVARYEGWIQRFGPVFYFEHSEKYKPAAVSWYMQNSYVRWVLPGNVCPASPDLASGGPCNTPLGAVQPDGLIGFIQQRFSKNTAFLSSYGIDANDPIAVQHFVESLDVRVIPKDDATLRGMLPGAEAYVHVIRNKTPGTPEFGTTDLQFWIFYPYNGPGTLEVITSVFGISYEPTEELDPLGTHIPDWENATVRVSNATGEIVQVTGSAHGDVHDMAGRGNEGSHPVVYSSRNGHAVWPTPGNNPNVLKDYSEHLEIPFFPVDIPLGTFGIKVSGLNITSAGDRMATADRYQLMAVYDTCVDANSPVAGMCQGMNPVQGIPVPAPIDALHYVVPIGSCSYLDQSLAIRPEDKPALPAGGASADLMTAICPRVFTAGADGSAASNREWWLFGHFGREVVSVLQLNAWEKWVHEDLSPGIFGAIGIACLPFSAILGVGCAACFAAVAASFEIALPLIKDQAINAFLPPPGSPPSPYWKDCALRRDGSC